MSKRTTAAVWVQRHRRHACRRRYGRAWIDARGRDRSRDAGRARRAARDREDQPPVGARGRALGQSGARARAAPGGAAGELRRGRLHDVVMREPARRLRAAGALSADPQRRADHDGERRARRISGDVRAVRRRPAGAAPAHRVHLQHGDRFLPLDQRARGLSGGDRARLSGARGSCALPRRVPLPGHLRRAVQQPAVCRRRHDRRRCRPRTRSSPSCTSVSPANTSGTSTMPR